MSNEYPTEEQLDTIKDFDLIRRRIGELLDYIELLWKYPERFVRGQHTLYLSTGGWSGNEDIIGALRRNFVFWSLYWRRSERGGHYFFDDENVSKAMKGFTNENRF